MADPAHDVVVVGGGPGGLAAATVAAEHGRSVALVDSHPALGGQIWRRDHTGERTADAATWLRRAHTAGVEVIAGTTVVHAANAGELFAEHDGRMIRIRGERLVLALGAQELLLPFPGWELPGVTGVGGLQALVKGGAPIAGKRVAIVGSGPLLLAVAAFVRGRGAVVACVAEQADLWPVIKFSTGLLGHPRKAMQGAGLLAALAGVGKHHGTWPVAASGSDRVERVTLRRGFRTFDVACDYLACGFGLLPSVGLAQHLGCTITDGRVWVDDHQRTSVDGVYCVGEATGIGGVDLATVEGEIAGLCVADRHDSIGPLSARRRHEQAFADRLARAYALRPELGDLADGDTVVCRCEDVTLASLRAHDDVRDAKLKTRCGMGPCQGRMCGPALEIVLGHRRDRVRPPLFPVTLGALATIAVTDQPSETTR